MNINQTDTEIEVKLYIPDHTGIIGQLESLGAAVVQPRTFEYNVRYDRDTELTDEGQALRLRRDQTVTLTYKGAKTIERGLNIREELEVEISDFETMAKILQKFGFESFMIYEKYRTVYELNGAEIMLDELPYGNFVEVEGTGDAIERTISVLGLQDVERREDSYIRLFDFVKHHLELTFNDLTFDNFADLDVPESAFIPPGSIVIR